MTGRLVWVIAFCGYLCLESLGTGVVGVGAVELTAFPPKHVAASRIADGRLLYRDHVRYAGMVYHYPPVFLYTLGGVYAVLGTRLVVGHAVLAASIVLSGLAVFRLAADRFDRRTGWLAAGLFLLNPVTLVVAYGNYFDPFPIALTLLSVLFLRRGHAAAGGVTLGLAAASKPFPAVLGPLAVLYCYRASGTSAVRFVGGVVGAMGVVSAPFLLLAPADYLRYAVLFNFQRPTASLSLFYYYLPWLEATPASVLLPGGFVLAVTVLADRHHPQSLVHGTTPLVLGFLLFNRINYPHYLVYVVPFFSLAVARAFTTNATVRGWSHPRLLVGGFAATLVGAGVWSLPWLRGVERIDTAQFAFKSSPLFWLGSAWFFLAGFALLAVSLAPTAWSVRPSAPDTDREAAD